ncbi:hypothetical protein HU200_042062 [Digitaria exilis]|uniref:Uncharacterized protein n=1 Tax=Digitaria exilis TaxID=1010633 RepID=A0A835EHG8_9POAL|nr:hypothetical protein HU200_042062 [Digitaria exilis]
MASGVLLLWRVLTIQTCPRARCPGVAVSSLNSPVVLDGVLHWLISSANDSFADHIITYDAGTSTVGSIGLREDLLPAKYSYVAGREAHLGVHARVHGVRPGSVSRRTGAALIRLRVLDGQEQLE